MPQVYPLTWQPDVDLNWSLNPGVCTSTANLFPRQNGHLAGAVSSANLGFAVTGLDAMHAEIFMQVNASARLLVFRTSNIDEYTNAGVRTNRGTGYSASTTDWNATAVGNQIIACNYLDATQSSTGAGFSGLGGGSPKARYIASNINFVMLADVDDGGSNVFSDMVWWSGIRNQNTFVPSQATQAGFIRLLDAPGPIKNIVPLGDKFVAFKGDSIFVGTYVGPPYVFSWRLVANNIGLTYPKALTELDGKLYFIHRTGIFSFDGQQVQNIGHGVWGTMNGEATQSVFRLRGDVIEGNLWVVGYDAQVGAHTRYLMYVYSFNARTGQWARVGLVGSFTDGSADNPPQPVVYGTTSEYRAFNDTWGVYAGFAYLDNLTPQIANVTAGNVSASGVTVTTGFIGANDNVARTTRVYPRLVGVSSSSPYTSGTLTPYVTEFGSAGTAVTLGYNSNTDTLDGVLAARLRTVGLTFASSKIVNIAGIGVDNVGASKV